MHTIAGYFDLTDTTQPKLISDPVAARGKPHDRGANQLFYTKTLELHAYWDKKIALRVQREEPNESLAAQLSAHGTGQQWATPGDYHQWATKWAGESAKEAIAAYEGIYFGQATLNPDGSLGRIEITLPDNYLETQTPCARSQLSTAAVHLAQLLNSIRYSDALPRVRVDTNWVQASSSSAETGRVAGALCL